MMEDGVSVSYNWEWPIFDRPYPINQDIHSEMFDRE